jgi:hypothetical protein
MRILTFALLLCAGVALSQLSPSNPFFTAAVLKPAAGGAAPTYLLEEGFEGTGYDEILAGSWTESSGTPDEDYATSPAPLVGSQSLELNDGGTNERADSPSFTDTADVWFFCYIHFNSLPAGTESIISIRNGTTEMLSAQVTSSGTWRLSMTGGNSAATTAAMSAGTTYKVRIRYTAGGGATGFGSFEFATTGGTFDGSGTDYTSKSDSTATLSAQNLRLRSEGAIQLFMDRVLVDDAEIGSNP